MRKWQPLKKKVLNVQSHGDSIKRQFDSSKGEFSTAREQIILDWQKSKVGKDYVADMGLEGAKVSTRDTLLKIRTAISEVSPSTDWDLVKAEYDSIIEAELADAPLESNAPPQSNDNESESGVQDEGEEAEDQPSNDELQVEKEDVEADNDQDVESSSSVSSSTRDSSNNSSSSE